MGNFDTLKTNNALINLFGGIKKAKRKFKKQQETHKRTVNPTPPREPQSLGGFLTSRF